METRDTEAVIVEYEYSSWLIALTIRVTTAADSGKGQNPDQDMIIMGS
jgi:hypothetical protein